MAHGCISRGARPETLDKIQRSNLDGSDVVDLVDFPASSSTPHAPFGIALDLSGGKMYWADGVTGDLVDLGGSASAPYGIALAIPEPGTGSLLTLGIFALASARGGRRVERDSSSSEPTWTVPTSRPS
jgi:hypothetical protein